MAAHMDYETEYSCVTSAVNDIDTQLSQCTDLCAMDRCAVEELSTRLQVVTIVSLLLFLMFVVTVSLHLMRRSYFVSINIACVFVTDAYTVGHKKEPTYFCL